MPFMSFNSKHEEKDQTENKINNENIFLRTINSLKKKNKNIKRYALVRFRFFNVFLLCTVFILFIVSILFHDQGAIFALFKSFSEAAMVGALADWFAVVALFKHPLGLPIPHTAIIPKNKNRIAESLADFVEAHFLNEEVITTKIGSTNPSCELSKLLQKDDIRRIIITNTKNILPEILKIFQNKDFSRFVISNLKGTLRSIELSTVLSNLLESLTRNEEHKKWINYIIYNLRKFLYENEEIVKENINEEISPWWTFGVLDNKIYKKILKFVDSLLNESGDKKFRIEIDSQIRNLIINLKQDEEFKKRIEDIKQKFIENEELTNYIMNIFNDLNKKLNTDIDDSQSELLELIDTSLKNFANDLEMNIPVQKRINDFVREVATKTISTNASKISSIITDTMGKWDDTEVTEELEIQIGKDLQYIRVNGTLVGGLIGIFLYLINSII